MRWSTGERVQEHNGAGSKDKVGEKGGAEGDGGLGRQIWGDCCQGSLNWGLEQKGQEEMSCFQVVQEGGGLPLVA